MRLVGYGGRNGDDTRDGLCGVGTGSVSTQDVQISHNPSDSKIGNND